MKNRKRALPLGMLAVGLLVVLAGIGIVSGLWSKNLTIEGTVETGDLNVDWTLNTTGVGDDLCTQFNPLFPCDGVVRKDVGKFNCTVDREDQQILHFVVSNAYPSYEADCQYHFKNTGSIPFNVIGAAVSGGGDLTGCGGDVDPDPQVIQIECDQMTIGYFDNIGRQIDPGQEQSGSLKIHVKQAAGQSDCTAQSTDIPGGAPAVIVHSISCDEGSLVRYDFKVKVCVAQWNEAATYEQCVASPQHEGPQNDLIIDADGIATRGDGLGTCGSPVTLGSQDVVQGDPLNSFPSFGSPPTGLDWFDQDGNGVWTMTCSGDDLHSEDPGTCAGADRDGVHDLGIDCKVLDYDNSLVDQEQVDCDIEAGANFGTTVTVCPDPLVKYHDDNGNGSYEMGEDLVFDANNDGIFD